MNLFEYVTKMEESRSVMAYVGVGFLALIIIFITIKMLIGMRRGLWHQLISTGLTFTAAMIAYLTSINLDTIISEKFEAPILSELINVADQYSPGLGQKISDILSSFGDGFFSKILSVPLALIIAPIAMVVLFLVIALLFKIVKGILVKIFKVRKAKSNPSRLAGVLLAVVESIIVLAIVLVPTSGIVGIVDDVYTDAISYAEGEEQQEMTAVYDEIISPVTNNPVFGFVNAFGSEKAYQTLAVVKSEGKKIDMRKEAVEITHLILIDAPDLFDIDFSSLTAEDKATIDKVISGVCESEYLSTIIVKLLNGAATAIDKGIINFNLGGAYKSLFNDVIYFLGSISEDTLREDVGTVKDLYFTVADSGILNAVSDGGDIMELLQERRKGGDDTVTKIVTILQNNKRTSMMVKSMTEALISTLSTNINLGDDVTIT